LLQKGIITMADFLTTSGISYQIEELIRSSKGELILVTPYLKLSQILFERLKDADKRGVTITLIYGKQELKQDQIDNLNSLENLELYYLENLHAKCYVNENFVILSSMNLYDFSEKNNREMGVLIKKSENQSLYDNVKSEIISIIDAGECKKSTNSGV